MNGLLSSRWRAAHDDARSWTPAPVSTVVLVPHPDDEVLLFGGLIAHQVDSGVDVTVIAITDGEAAYPDADPHGLGSLRRSEQNNALQALAEGPITTVRLGLPDGDVAANAEVLVDVVAEYCDGAVLVVAPWTLDHHCDHEALGRAAAEAVRRSAVGQSAVGQSAVGQRAVGQSAVGQSAVGQSAVGQSGAQLVFGLFWAWHHRTPNEVPAPLLALELGSTIEQRKQRALDCHRSQLDWPDGEPILNPAVLEPLYWPAEYYLSHTPQGRPQ